MSEEQRITKVEKEKDPRRVEAGKRLGAISRVAKEKKMMERAQAEDKETMNNTEERPNDTETNYMSILTGVGVLTGLVCLYFTYKQDKRATVTESPVETQSNDKRVLQKQSTIQKPSKPTGSRAVNKLRSLDD